MAPRDPSDPATLPALGDWGLGAKEAASRAAVAAEAAAQRGLTSSTR